MQRNFFFPIPFWFLWNPLSILKGAVEQMMKAIDEISDGILRSMGVGAVFTDFVSSYSTDVYSVLVFFLIHLLCFFDSKWYFSASELQTGRISSIDFHRKEDLLITACEDDSVRIYDTANAK